MLILVATLTVAGCSGTQQPVQPQTTANTEPSPAATLQRTAVPTAISQGSVSANTVLISDYAFVPQTITVRGGEIVRWENRDATPHRIMFTDATGRDTGVESSALSSSQSYSRKFETAGTYPYYCKIHPDMKGTVIVE